MTAERLSERISLCQAAAEHMGSALALLDQAGATRAAALLDQALHAIPGSLGEHISSGSLTGIWPQANVDDASVGGSAEELDHTDAPFLSETHVDFPLIDGASGPMHQPPLDQV